MKKVEIHKILNNGNISDWYDICKLLDVSEKGTENY